MLPRTKALFVAAIITLSPTAHAQDVVVKTASDSVKLGGELRTELTYDDHGFASFGQNKPDTTTALQVQTAKLKLEGKINPRTEYKFRFNLLNPKATPLDYGYATHNISMFAVSAGRMKVLQGGWDNMDNGFKDHVQGPYAKNLAFDKYKDMIALHLNMGGKMTLQLFDDVSKSDASWNKGEHPTFVVGFQSKLGIVSPIIDYGSYDNNKSRWIDLGAKLEFDGVKAGLDLKLDSIVRRQETPGEVEELEDTASSWTFKAAYEVKGIMMPWIYYSSYQRTQASEDASVNTVNVDADGKKSYELDDNGKTWGLGVDVLMLGNGWTPYIAAVATNATYPTDDVDLSRDSERVHTQVRIGVLGAF